MAAELERIIKELQKFNKADEVYIEQCNTFEDKLKIARKALMILKKYNPLHNDFEAYLFEITKWGLGETEKPDPKDYGIE